MLKDGWGKTKSLVKRPVDKLKKMCKNKVNLLKLKIKTSSIETTNSKNL